MEETLASHLKVLREHWGVLFPDWLNIFIDLWQSQEFSDSFNFFLGSPKGNPSGDKPANYRRVIGEIPGIHRKIIYVLGDIFPSFRFMKNRYGCSSNMQAMLYYPHRIGKLMWLFRGKSKK